MQKTPLQKITWKQTTATADLRPVTPSPPLWTHCVIFLRDNKFDVMLLRRRSKAPCQRHLQTAACRSSCDTAAYTLPQKNDDDDDGRVQFNLLPCRCLVESLFLCLQLMFGDVSADIEKLCVESFNISWFFSVFKSRFSQFCWKIVKHTS